MGPGEDQVPFREKDRSCQLILGLNVSTHPAYGVQLSVLLHPAGHTLQFQVYLFSRPLPSSLARRCRRLRYHTVWVFGSESVLKVGHGRELCIMDAEIVDLEERLCIGTAYRRRMWRRARKYIQTKVLLDSSRNN